MSMKDHYRNVAVENLNKAQEVVDSGPAYNVNLATHYREMAKIYAMLYQGAR